MFSPRVRVHAVSSQLFPVMLLTTCCLLLTVAAGAQEAMLHDGQPALVFHADPDMTTSVDLVDHDGERALRFPVQHSHMSTCTGYLYISRSRISYDPVNTPKFQKDAFVLERSDIKEAWVGTEALTHDYLVAIFNGKKRYLFYALFDSGSRKKSLGKESAGPVYQFIGRSLADFDSTLHGFEGLTANLGQQPQQQPEQQHPQERPSPTAQPAESAASAPSLELKEGQTPQEVENLLGKPKDTITLKGNLVYIYSTVKVIFENGKLVDVQYQQK